MPWATAYSRHCDFPWSLRFEHKAKVSEECTLGWQLDIADSCINGRALNGRQRGPIYDSGSAELRIVLSYFEMMARMKAGFAGKGQ
jgi:hypothetical protein